MKNKPFKNLLLIGRAGIEGVPETLLALLACLKDTPSTVFIESSTALLIDAPTYPLLTLGGLKNHAIDLIVVVGGDGSLLNASHTAVRHQIPILGVNRGRLGFLTDIHPNALESIKAVLLGDYQSEPRFLLEASLWQQDTQLDHALALNDVVILPGKESHMIEFEVYIDGQFVCYQHADGLITSTPTGSTAYALSGGGPILHPRLSAIALVPMFPHNLNSRPIVVPGDAAITLKVTKHKASSPNLSADGQARIGIPPGAHVTIKQHDKALTLIHPLDYTYYERLRSKLGWEKPIIKIPR